MTRRAVILQASDLLVRGDLAVSPETTGPAGEPVNALLATVRALRRTLAMRTPDDGIALLGPAPRARALKQQHAGMAEVLRLHGFQVVQVDDPTHAAGRYVRAAQAAGHDVVVVGYDKRLGQLVDERTWFYDAYKDVRYTPEVIFKRFGVPPEQLAAWLALVGDRYNTPGVAGVGAKGAVDLLAEHGSVEGALAQLETLPGRLGKALRAAGAEAVRAAVANATLADVGELPPPWETPDPAAVDALYQKLGLVSMVRSEEAGAVEIGGDPSSLDLSGLVSIEALCGEPSAVRGPFVGLAVATASRTVYLPAEQLQPLAAWLADPDAPKVGHDPKQAQVALERIGLTLAGVIGDVAIASHLLEPSNLAPHELPTLARAYLERPLQTPDEVLGKGAARKGWEQVDPAIAAAYTGARARAALDLWAVLGPRVDATLLADALALCQVLVRMELAGMPCDADDLATSGEDFEAIRIELEAEIFALAGHTFEINSTKQLGEVLYAELGLPVVARTKTGWSTANHALERLVDEHPIVELVMRWRLLRRLQDSWVTALIKAIEPDGRVRSTFHPARSFSGRLVNSAPDLGRVPGRTPEMARIRRAFRAPPGTTLLSIDYDQLGLYVLAHLSGDPNLVGPLTRGEDIHAATARAVLELDADAPLTDEQRQVGKVVNFATFAGQGASSLALQLKLSAAEAKVLIDRFFVRYSEVRAFLDLQLHLAQTRGFVTTIVGRPWPIRDLSSKNPMIRGYAERLASRATHEGSVADVTRAGLLAADQALRGAGLRAFPLVQIHDEVLFQVPDGEFAAVMQCAGTAMREAMVLRVPLRVGFKVGPTWADLEPYG